MSKRKNIWIKSHHQVPINWYISDPFIFLCTYMTWAICHIRLYSSDPFRSFKKFKFHFLTDTKTKTSVNWTINFSLESSLISASSGSLWICVLWCACDSFSCEPFECLMEISSVLWSFYILLYHWRWFFGKLKMLKFTHLIVVRVWKWGFLLLLTFLHIPYSIIKELRVLSFSLLKARTWNSHKIFVKKGFQCFTIPLSSFLHT